MRRIDGGNQQLGAGALAGRRVLVVEDDWLVANETAQLLQSVGAVIVGPAPDVERARALLQASEIDAALIDINLNGVVSYEIADLLFQRGVKFAFMTGYTREVLPRRFANTPMHEKPFDPRRALTELLLSADA